MSLAPGSSVGPYEIASRIGAGGMGEVWLATETRLRRKVALKFLTAGLTADPRLVSRFQQEARAASALNHPNACTILAIGESTEGQHYIAMEYVEGETLRQRLCAGPVHIRQALDIALQIASALVAAHDVGIVHRDIKPEDFVEFGTGRRTTLATIAKRWWFGMALSPDERWLLFPVTDREGRDLMLVDNIG